MIIFFVMMQRTFVGVDSFSVFQEIYLRTDDPRVSNIVKFSDTIGELKVEVRHDDNSVNIYFWDVLKDYDHEICNFSYEIQHDQHITMLVQTSPHYCSNLHRPLMMYLFQPIFSYLHVSKGAFLTI